LTDLIAMASQAKGGVSSVLWKEEMDLRGVNDPWELASARQIFNQRLIRFWAKKGIQFLKPDTVYLDADVILSDQVSIHTGVALYGATQVGQGVTLEPHVVLKNVQVGQRSVMKTGTVAEDVVIGDEVKVGPYAHLRPGARLENQCKIGNFVELKKTLVEEGSSIAHLSYLGDAKVGKNVNIGCGFVTCNYDGREVNGQRKHQTIIEDDVFLGSACQAVAPVRIGQGAYVASGSTITEDVESGALAIARARQVNKPGYADVIKGKRK
jgi:bifunctional UDP-N-acetylglucosamine pyrophosphorylase/glucosamine-1-phosphate N-acetyltransferase